MYKTIMEKNQKNNVTSHYAKTYIIINCKTQHCIAIRNNIITSLVPVWHWFQSWLFQTES